MAPKKLPPLIENFDSIPNEALVPVDEQPYPIPKHWKWVQLGYIIRLLSGRDEPLAACNSEQRGIPYLMGASNFFEGQIQFERWITEPKIVSKKGDLLLTVKGTIGKMAIQQDPKVNLSRQVMALQPSNLLEVKYLEYYLSTVIKELKFEAVGLIPGISRDVLLTLPIPLPPSDDQKQIIKNLSQHLRKIDQAINHLEAYLNGSETRIESLLSVAMQGQLTDKWRSRRKCSRNTWKKTTLGEAFKWSSGGTPSRKHPEYYSGNIPWLKSGELPDGFIEDSEEHITAEAISNSSAKVFPQGTVLIAMYGATIGRVGILGLDAATNQAIAAAKEAKHTLRRYLFFYLWANRNNFIALGKGGAQPNISQRVIKSFPYAYPSIAEQEEILRIIDLNLDTLAATESAVAKSLTRLKRSKKSLISAAMAGKLTQTAV